MKVKTPEIDSRNHDKLVCQLRKNLATYAGDWWPDVQSVENDPQAESMVQIFARMIEITNKRLNRVPDKNFLSFMEMLGIDLLPPRAAKTYLQFFISSNGPDTIVVPAETQVAVTGTTGDPIIFETSEDLTVVKSNLDRMFSHDPFYDSYANHTRLLLTEDERESAALFAGNAPVKHRFYAGHQELFGFDEVTTIKLHITLKEDLGLPPTEDWSITWYAILDETGEPVSLLEYNASQIPTNPDAAPALLLQSGIVTLTGVNPIAKSKLEGYLINSLSIEGWEQFSLENHWIYAELKSGLPVGTRPLPEIESINIEVTIDTKEETLPDMAFLNRTAVDLTKDFYIFGERPSFNDTFYFASNKVFSKKDASVTIQAALSPGLPIPGSLEDTFEIQLVYEFWNGTAWEIFGESDENGQATDNYGYDFVDDSNAFSRDKADAGSYRKISFICPDIKPTKVNGKENHWIRIRIVRGDYGQEASYKKLEGGGYEPVPATYSPPSMNVFNITYQFTTPEDQRTEPENLIFENNFFYEDVSDIQGSAGSVSKSPFKPTEEESRAVYFGFDKDIRNLPINMFFSIPGGSLNAFRQGEGQAAPYNVWECWTGTKWASISAIDFTESFAKKEMVRLLVPDEFNPRPLFGVTRNWIRVRLDQGEYLISPEVQGLFTNVVWSSHLVTIRDELLGSSNGQPNQTFPFSRKPVLYGQAVLIREEGISDEDRIDIIAEEGDDAIREISDDGGNILETWVRWHEVNRFDFSGPRSRHYVLDHSSGIVYFGDGRRGIIPPAGRNNIKCDLYQYGGGTRGNVNAGQISDLRTAIPFIDSVCNPETVEGGVDLEDLDGLRARGPRSIKSRNRVVTTDDYEALVAQSTGEIARVKCLPTMNQNFEFEEGWATVIIVPNSNSIKPYPSQELINFVYEYLSTRASGDMVVEGATRINVTGPRYLQVYVEADVRYENIRDAKTVESRIREALDLFFNPLIGGPDLTGWEFGRNVFISEIYKVIEDVEGVDHVGQVSIKPSEQIYRVHPFYSFAAPAPYPVNSSVTFSGKRGSIPVEILMRLAQEIPEKEETTGFTVVGFKENEPISLLSGDGLSQENFFVKSIRSGTLDGLTVGIIDVEKKTAQGTYARGLSRVMTRNGLIASTLLEDITEFSEINKLVVAVPIDVEGNQDRFRLVHRLTDLNYEEGRISNLANNVDTVYLDKNFLTYPGNHVIRAVVD